MIQEQYISFETAKLLKEKNFERDLSFDYKDMLFCMYDSTGTIHWGCYADSWYPRVTQALAMKWLRKVHNLHIAISHRFSHNGDNDVCFSYYINIDEGADGEWLSYEEACEAAIKYCLENLI